MKRKNFCLLVFLSVLLNQGLPGQTVEENAKIKVFGLGIHIEQYKLIDLWMTGITTEPFNKIAFTITPTNHFRLEPEIGYSRLNDRIFNLKYNAINFGIGGFGMIQRGKTNLYGGFRYQYDIISNDTQGSGINSITTEKKKRSSIGPVIGAEYFPGPHFSLGGEIGISYMTINGTNSQFNTTVKQYYTSTNLGFFVRFYF
jgi:hypothetical protein